MVQSGSKRMAERRATLFDGMLVFSKRKRSSSASGQAAASGALAEYKMKDLIFTRKVEIKDRDDTEGTICDFRHMFGRTGITFVLFFFFFFPSEMKNAFEIVPREQLPFVCVVKTYEEKCLWMSDLIMLNIKWYDYTVVCGLGPSKNFIGSLILPLIIYSMLDRSLNSVLDDIERKNPLQMPPVEKYRFAEPDSPSNIVFEGSMIKVINVVAKKAA
jgi:hypothetical protein